VILPLSASSAPAGTVLDVPPELIRFRDLPEVLEVSPATAARYARRRDFPKAQPIAGVRFWVKTEVKRWGKQNRPSLGRPPAG
jgi:predicted DNA-binding transcriptional regulator AlpA